MEPKEDFRIKGYIYLLVQMLEGRRDFQHHHNRAVAQKVGRKEETTMS